MAEKMLPKYKMIKDVLQGLDKAKFLLIELEIQRSLRKPGDDKELKAIIDAHTEGDEEWNKVRKKYLTILKED